MHRLRQLLQGGDRQTLRARHRAAGEVIRISEASSSPNTQWRTRRKACILRRSDETGCVFLDGKDCTIYDDRPDTCRRFPHMVRGNGSIASRMWQFIDRACYCPIVYNALEAFKEETKFRR